MRTLILTQLIQHTRKTKFSIMLIAFVLTLATVEAQVDCNSIMACNDNLQVSLGDDCEAVITPDFILEAQSYPDNYYSVELRDENDNIIPNATVNVNHIGQNISAIVTLNGCELSCWGGFTVEDKLAPVVGIPADIFLDCDEDPNLNPIKPIATDACDNNLEYGFSDEIFELGCGGLYSKRIERNWVIADQSGNTATAVQLIFLRQGRLDNIVWPHNYDDIDQDVFSCYDNIPLLDSGAPDPDYTGFPSNVECGNIQFYYEDIIFEICGSSTKTLRQWTVINWCTGQDTVHNQIIKIMDNEGPVCVAPQDFYYDQPTDEGVCTGTFDVPAPIVIDCSDWDYTVAYKLRDENGNPFDFPITDNVSKINDGGGNYHFRIHDLPQDTTWIVYTITDACGNEVKCFTEVSIIDQEQPTPICDGYTVVSLDDKGWADAYAETFDDGSWDNCEIDRFEVKRDNSFCPGYNSDLNFGETVNFCCGDVGQGYVKVTMRVYDVAGNYNDCVIYVEVQDKFDPTINCPDDIHISCKDDYTDLSITGEAEGEDNCYNLVISHTDNTNLNDCGVGYVVRTWRATDPQGRYATCTQRIYLDNLDPIHESDIQWPNNLELNTCGNSGLDPDSLNSKPIIYNDGCNNVAIGYNDQFFYNVPGFCVKIIRKWSIMDWCANNNGQGAIIATKDQIIKINNNVAPTFTGCSNLNFDAEPGECERTVEIGGYIATDDCTPADKIIYNYNIDVDNNGSNDYSGYGNNINRVLPVGTHKIKITAEDECGNEGQCVFLVTINDNKPPTPICYSEVVWGLDEDGTTVVWASDFDFKSEDTCPEGGVLTFSFTPPSEGITSSMSFTCDDLDNGIAQLIPLNMYVIDESGNYSYCSVHLNLQDNQDICTDVANAVATISGKVMFPNNSGISNLNVELNNVTDQEDHDNATDQEGAYEFDNLGFYDNYKINANLQGSPMEGVSTLDLVIIQRHILKLKEFNNPYNMIAADINNSGSISAKDLIDLRRLILGKISDFEENTSWKYINANEPFEDELEPWDYQEGIDIESLYLSKDNADLYAIKIGDVNNTVVDNFAGNDDIDDRNLISLPVSIKNQSYVADQVVEVELSLNEMISLAGMQFTLEFDAKKLSFLSIESSAVNVGTDNISTSMTKKGLIGFSWNNAEELELNRNDVLFTVKLKALNAGKLENSFDINSNLLKSEAYNESLEVSKVVMNVIDENEIVSENVILLQNSPNPFNSNTIVMFELPFDELVKLSISDLSGRLIKSYNVEGKKALNKIEIQKEEIGNTGVFYYTLETNNNIITKKMIIL